MFSCFKKILVIAYSLTLFFEQILHIHGIKLKKQKEVYNEK